MSPTSSNTPRSSKANGPSKTQKHTEEISQGTLQNVDIIFTHHRSMQDSVNASSDVESDKYAKKASKDAYMVSWLNISHAYEHRESEKQRQCRLVAAFARMDQVQLGRGGGAVDVREGDEYERDESRSGDRGEAVGLEGVGAWVDDGKG